MSIGSGISCQSDNAMGGIVSPLLWQAEPALVGIRPSWESTILYAIIVCMSSNFLCSQLQSAITCFKLSSCYLVLVCSHGFLRNQGRDRSSCNL